MGQLRPFPDPKCFANWTVPPSCTFQWMMDSDELDVSDTIIHADIFSLWLFSCSTTSFEIDFSFMAKNPTGHLSTSEAPLPDVYFALCVIWGVINFLWLTNWAWNWRQPFIALHVVLTLLPSIKLAAVIIGRFMWVAANEQGAKSDILKEENQGKAHFFVVFPGHIDQAILFDSDGH